jgi:hypothetical protein
MKVGRGVRYIQAKLRIEQFANKGVWGLENAYDNI